MRNGIFAALVLGALLLGLAGCATSAGSTGSSDASGSGEGTALEIVNGTETLDGVTVTIESATATPKTEPSRYEYAIDIAIENESDVSIMQVGYAISVLDADGNELRSFTGVYDGEDRAIAPGETVHEHDGDLRTGGQAQPATISLTMSWVTPESELAAVRLPQKGEFLYKALDNDKLANIRQEPPTELRFHIDRGGFGRTATFTEGSLLDEAVDLFCDITIGDETGEWVTDNYNWVWLTWPDGSSANVSLNLRNLEYSTHGNKTHRYELENLDPFWSFATSHATDDAYIGDDA